jgi:hypothetical protein
MSKRPEGLSPCYFSLASPDIPASHYFKWTWPGQTSATIKIYASNKTTLLKTYNVAGSTQSVEMTSIGFTFTNGTTYYWTVQAQNSEVSVMAKFKYDVAPQKPGIAWSALSPKLGDLVRKSARFEEIKANLNTLLNNYEGVPSSMRTTVSRLFTGNIVPSKSDFNSLQSVIEFIGEKEGIQYRVSNTASGAKTYQVVLNPTPARKYDTTDPVFSPFDVGPNPEIAPETINVIQWISDSLGASDIDKVIDYINYLTTIAPKPVERISFSIPNTDMYQMSSVSATSQGKEDKTVDVSWTVQSIKDTSAKVLFNDLSPSKDIWFYDCEFAYGPNGRYKSRIFIRPEDVRDISGVDERLFETNWDGLYTDSTLDEAMLRFEMATVDHYGNISPIKTTTRTFGSNFKVPIGVDSYILQVQRTDIGSTGYSTDGSWYTKYTGTKTSASYTITSEEGRMWHRIKVIDKSGLQSGWKYASGSILFDPLDPPAKPKNFRADNIGLNQIGLYWSPVPTAEKYQVYKWITPGTKLHEGVATGNSTTRGIWATGVSEGTSYNFYVRAYNRKGWGPWASLTAKTKERPIHEKTWSSVHAHSWNDRYGWLSNQGVGHTHIYQGEWNNGGNYKGLWYFDYGNMQSTLKGKEILEVWIECQRLRAGYVSAGVARFWTHNRDYNSWYYNHSTSPGTLSDPGARSDRFDKNGHYANDYWFSIGEKQWVKLPKEYGEWIRDNKAKGIAVHEEDGYRYLKFDNNARLRIKYR